MGHQLPIIRDLLVDSIDHAKECFVIVQLGSRYGRFIVSSSRILKRRRPGLKSISIGVEASPDGYTNLLETMEEHGLSSPPNIFHHRAVSDSLTSKIFLESGDGSHLQTKTPKDSAKTGNLVSTTTIEEVLKDVSHVDFMEMDIQSAEYKAISHSMRVINKKVKMICVRTHFPVKKEQQLEARFKKLGWQRVLVLNNRTPMQILGKEQPLIDGIHCWVNTRLREPSGIPDKS